MKVVQWLLGILMLAVAMVPFGALTEFLWPGMPWYIDSLISIAIFIAAIALVFLWPLVSLTLCGVGVYAAIEYHNWYMLAGGIIALLYPQLAAIGWCLSITAWPNEREAPEKENKMGKSTAILIAAVSFGAIASLFLERV